MYGRILRQLRESKGRLQAEVARSVGISPAQLARLESNQRGLYIEDFVRIAEALGEKPGNLLSNDVGLSAAVTAVLFVIGKFALGIYHGKAAVGSAFGAAGSIVVVLLWAYWSAQIFFFGLELTHVYATSGDAA